MKILLNSTKTMDPDVATRLKTTAPRFVAEAQQLMAALKPLSRGHPLAEFDLSENTLPAARAHIARWGEDGVRPPPPTWPRTGSRA
ncbi:YaaA family protein [bacterium]|nr:YaaA family protein [bacterium]PIV80437.1 MAG: hypothetical protein COW53_09705 [bacterium CG17_big_fil_post_rev_8_21_14_2_50_64_8]PJA74598.1 MAG: hypothetical protein CO151_09105 [bacterium CG_4_9_14_3_um_filter_65_15]